MMKFLTKKYLEMKLKKYNRKVIEVENKLSEKVPMNSQQFSYLHELHEELMTTRNGIDIILENLFEIKTDF